MADEGITGGIFGYYACLFMGKRFPESSVLGIGLRNYNGNLVGDEMTGKYWDKAWSLVDGCTPCSPGCDNCWSMAMNKRFKKWPEKVTPRWERLDIPLRTRKPTVFAVWNDLFHEDVPGKFIDEAFTIMCASPQHTFLVLTKRPTRMADGLGMTASGTISNIWCGVTVCNQAEADEKIPALLQIPGKKFLSIEPMLGAIDCEWALGHISGTRLPHIDAVILGGETGPHARPMHPDWVRSVRDQCQAANVPFFFKQWGEWVPADIIPGGDLGGDLRCGTVKHLHAVGNPEGYYRKGDAYVRHVGRNKAGRLLDGREHNDLPWR